MKILYGKPIAENIQKNISKKIKSKSNKNKVATLGIFRIGDDPSSIAYENSITKLAEKLNVKTEKVTLKNSVSQTTAQNELKKLSDKKTVKGIITLRPFPKKFKEDDIIKTLSPEKDIDGITLESSANIYSNKIKEKFIPCTAAAVMKIFSHYKINLEGKNVIIVGRSKTVGKPLSMLLLNKNATVTIAHSKTKNLSILTKKADILIAAIGKANFITEKFVSKNQIIIDVGTNFVKGKMCGDVSFEKVKSKVSSITPVPNGVGSITNSILFEHLVS